MSRVEELDNENRELLAILSATLWVLEHPDVNSIKFAGNPRGLADRIRKRLEKIAPRKMGIGQSFELVQLPITQSGR